MSANEPQRISIRQLLMVMVKQDASDLYITSGMAPSYRINNVVKPLRQEPLNGVQTEQLANSCMSEKQRTAFAIDMEMNLALAYEGMGRFRVNIFRQRGDVGMVIRKITTEVPTVDDLGLPEVFKEIVMNKRGLVIMVGATSSGKSTSLAAMLDYRNRNQAGHIITVEDPIEFVHRSKNSLISQRELGPHTHSFANALRSALREDPDVILVGELRDLETIRLALTAAETGHMVFGTLHTSSAPKTIDRVIDVFPAAEKEMVRSMLSESIRAVISQTLIKTADNQGRVAAHEIMLGTPAIRNLIRENKIAQMVSVLQTSSRDGMQTLDSTLQKLVKSRKITVQAAMEKASNKQLFGGGVI